jgi:mannose-1-phosphate guanylyltransferase
MYWAVIMAGGSGTRLWPLSREKHPKQSLKLVGDKTMFQHAVYRLEFLFPIDRILVVTRAEYVPLLHEQVPQLPEDHFILEPEGRGTAPAIGLAAVHLQQRDPDAIMAVLTADHYIADIRTFLDVLKAAETTARKGYLVTLGIQPTFPAAGYGYIEQDQFLELVDKMAVYQVHRFIEKPDQEAAFRMVTQGGYSWNSGMFVWQVRRILQEFATHMPNLFQALSEIARRLHAPDYRPMLKEIWKQVQEETIDYGVMEKTNRIAVIPVSIGWVDVGSWTSLDQLHAPDAKGNIWTTPHVAIDTQNTIAVSNCRKLIATIGVEDLIIIDSKDALLVCTKNREQEVKAVVNQLQREGRRRWL